MRLVEDRVPKDPVIHIGITTAHHVAPRTTLRLCQRAVENVWKAAELDPEQVASDARRTGPAPIASGNESIGTWSDLRVVAVIEGHPLEVILTTIGSEIIPSNFPMSGCAIDDRSQAKIPQEGPDRHSSCGGNRSQILDWSYIRRGSRIANAEIRSVESKNKTLCVVVLDRLESSDRITNTGMGIRRTQPIGLVARRLRTRRHGARRRGRRRHLLICSGETLSRKYLGHDERETNTNGQHTFHDRHRFPQSVKPTTGFCCHEAA